MGYCSAVNCKSRDGYTEDKKPISFHTFPTDKRLRKLWEERTRRKNFVGHKRTVLCGLHFTDDQFIIKPSIIESLGQACKPRCVRLIPGAIPSIFDYGVEKREPPKRKSRAAQKREIARLFKELLPPDAVTLSSSTSATHSRAMKPRTIVTQTQGHGKCSLEDYSSSTEQKALVYIDHAEDGHSSTENVRSAAHDVKKERPESATQKTLWPVGKDMGIVNACAQTSATFAVPVLREKGLAICHNEYLVHRTKFIDHSEMSKDIKPIFMENYGCGHDSVMGSDVKTEAGEEHVPHVKKEIIEDEYDVKEWRDVSEGDQHQFLQFHNEPDDGNRDLEIKRNSSNTSSRTGQTAGAFNRRATQPGYMVQDQLVMKRAKLEKPMSQREDIPGEELQEDGMEGTNTKEAETCSESDVSDAWYTFSSNIHKQKRTDTRQQSYKCDIRAKSFNNKCELTTHKRTHTGVKLYKCDMCAKSFNRKVIILYKNEHKKV